MSPGLKTMVSDVKTMPPAPKTIVLDVQTMPPAFKTIVLDVSGPQNYSFGRQNYASGPQNYSFGRQNYASGLQNYSFGRLRASVWISPSGDTSKKSPISFYKLFLKSQLFGASCGTRHERRAVPNYGAKLRVGASDPRFRVILI